MHFNKADTHTFQNSAEAYGVEVYGGTPEQRRAVFEIQFDEPTIFVDGAHADSADDLMQRAYRRLSGYDAAATDEVRDMVEQALTADDPDAVDGLLERVNQTFRERDEKIEQSYDTGSLRHQLEQAESNLVILGFDELPSETRTTVAQRMKALAEGLQSDAVKLGYTSATGGAVVHAEPDLRMRVRSWEVKDEAFRRDLPNDDESEGGEASTGNHVGPIVFADPDARRRLEQAGEVVTFRASERTTGGTWWRKSRTGPKMGNCRVEQIGPIDPADRSALREYHREAGFENAREWEAAIKELNGELTEGYLYRVTSDERWAECESCHEYSPEVATVGRGPNVIDLCPDCRGPPGHSEPGDDAGDEQTPAVRGPRPDHFPHHSGGCDGQFHYDDADNCYRCLSCGAERPFYAWQDELSQ